MNKTKLWIISTLFKALNVEKYKLQEVERIQRSGKLLEDLKKLRIHIEQTKNNFQKLEDEVKEIIYHENTGVNILDQFNKISKEDKYYTLKKQGSI